MFNKKQELSAQLQPTKVKRNNFTVDFYFSHNINEDRHFIIHSCQSDAGMCQIQPGLMQYMRASICQLPVVKPSPPPFWVKTSVVKVLVSN